MAMEIPNYVSIGDSVLFQRIQDEAVLLNMDSQLYYGLNSTGVEMWEQLVEAHDVQTVESRLSLQFDTEPAVLSADLRSLVAELVAAGLLKAQNRQD